jgi:serine/threonine-protein kinase RsbT
MGMRAAQEIRVVIHTDQDIVAARQKGRTLAVELGFSPGDATLVATAISELARNIVTYAGTGVVAIQGIQASGRQGILVIASDHGPGIADIRQAMRDGFSTSGSLGLGLPGVRRLMDEFDLQSRVGRGTTVAVKKWKP